MGSKIDEFILEERCKVKSSKRIFAREYVEVGVPFWRSKDVIDKSLGEFNGFDLFISQERYTEISSKFGSPQKDDILISSVGNRSGQPYVVQDEGPFYFKDGNIIWLSEFEGLDSYFLSYWLKSEIGQKTLSSVMIGSAQKALTIDAIRTLKLQLPEYSYQITAVETLRKFDSKIQLNRQLKQTLEQMAQTLFKSWFVDFDPVKAKMNGEQPKGMDAATASLFPEKLVESELGLIPEGWNTGTLSDVAKYCSARTSIDSISLNNYISTENMLADRKGVTAASKLPTAKMVAAYKTGDVLVSNIRPYFKKIWLAEGNGGRSNDVLGFESSVPYTNSYLMNLLYQDTFFEYMTRTSKGAKMPRGDKTAIMNWEMAVPPVELREAFSAIVNKFYKLIPQNRAQNETLESLRDTLLPKLLSGEIDLESLQVEQTKALVD